MIAKVNGKLLSLLLKMILNLSNLTEEMEKRLSDQLRYLTISAIDEEWGIVVTTVGYQFIPPKGNYPLSKHPDNYNFKPQTGRILNEYQLVYITKGSGYFSSQSCKMQKINAGTMILLFPGEWHSYYPDSETGWDEYWVGFRGVHIDRRVEKRFFTREEPLQHIGLSATIVGLYEDILKFASQEKTGYQEMISSIVLHILGTVYYKRRNNSFTNTYVVDKINEARILMKEQVENPLTPEEIASRLGLGYVQRIYRRIARPIPIAAKTPEGKGTAYQQQHEYLGNSLQSQIRECRTVLHLLQEERGRDTVGVS